jgi:general secretion pathway protein D
MIEARLVEVTANPKQGYGINWGGVVGTTAADGGKVFKYGAADKAGLTANPTLSDFAGRPEAGNILSGTITQIAPQLAILTAPQMSLTMRLLNEDSDAEFLANPRIVTANNQKATIKITRNQPVPQLNFNEQTATAVFGGFQDKEYGNTLAVTPVINKDNFVTLLVQPEISNKVGDSTFIFAGATVSSPIIDKRNLESNVLIRSGDTLAIGGLLQDENTRGRAKVPVAGDIPILGYLFQERLNVRTKRNLLCFVTPTVIKPGYGTGLEDQITGLKNVSDEFADPRGWRNNAKGAFRLVPAQEGSMASDYPPQTGAYSEPASKTAVRYRVEAQER